MPQWRVEKVESDFMIVSEPHKIPKANNKCAR